MRRWRGLGIEMVGLQTVRVGRMDWGANFVMGRLWTVRRRQRRNPQTISAHYRSPRRSLIIEIDLRTSIVTHRPSNLAKLLPSLLNVGQIGAKIHQIHSNLAYLWPMLNRGGQIVAEFGGRRGTVTQQVLSGEYSPSNCWSVPEACVQRPAR